MQEEIEQDFNLAELVDKSGTKMREYSDNSIMSDIEQLSDSQAITTGVSINSEGSEKWYNL